MSLFDVTLRDRHTGVARLILVAPCCLNRKTASAEDATTTHIECRLNVTSQCANVID